MWETKKELRAELENAEQRAVTHFRKLNQIESIMTGFLVWSINIKAIRKLRKSKFVKAAIKGLSLIQNVI